MSRMRKTTEVYSRITGYYRPVQNWNDGKRAEFAARKVYDVANSHFTAKDGTVHHEECKHCNKEETITSPILFTRNGCPNCKTSKMMLDKAGVKYEVIDAEQDKDMTLKFGVKKLPRF